MRNTPVKIKLKEGLDTSNLFGKYDIHLKMIEDAFDVKISARGEEILIEGGPEDINRTKRIISDLSDLIFLKGFYLRPNDVDYAIRRMLNDKDVSIKEIFSDTTPLETKKRLIIPKSATQKRYLEAMKKHDIVIAIGPAGTGKTYLAMAMAVTSLMRKEVSRIILARPAVEAGEKLGFLPGTISEKVNPYLRPLYDAMYDMMDLEKANRLIERGEIEIAPLAYMRGRTLNDSFVILDEAQNATSEQMKMFLTRLGFSSKSVITGDITQVDLPTERISGLLEIQKILSDIPGIEFIYFSEKDVVRHKLVQDIIKAYGRYEGKIGKGKRRETREA
ncbi:MAG: PhoH family protein [Nitrospirota bacterium]|mgnify:CR=1 FL=1